MKLKVAKIDVERSL